MGFANCTLPIVNLLKNGADRFWQDAWRCMPACRLMGWEP